MKRRRGKPRLRGDDGVGQIAARYNKLLEISSVPYNTRSKQCTGCCAVDSDDS